MRSGVWGAVAVADGARFGSAAADDAERAVSAGRRARQRGQRAFDALRVVADGAAILLAFTLSYRLYGAAVGAGVLDRPLPPPAPYASIALLFTAIAFAVFWHRGLYGRRASVLNLWEQGTALNCVVQAAAWLFGALFFSRVGELYSRLVVVGAILVAMPLVLVERRALAAVAAALQLRGRFGRNVVICGADATGQLLMKKIVQAPHIGYRTVGFLDDHATVGSAVSCRLRQTGPELFRARVLGRLDRWRQVVADHEVDDLLVAPSAVSAESLHDIFGAAHGLGVRVGVVPHLAGLRIDQLQVEDLSAVPVLHRQQSTTGLLYLLAKRALDVVGALVTGLLTLPLWGAAAVAVKLDSRGSAFFTQERVGLGGRRFRMYKFRTMWADAAPYASSPAGDVDPRITRVGRVLRTTGFDELPQLINVLRGEMSLVGPRPEMPYIVDRYTEQERQRLEAKPGISGIWQLSADRHAEIHENIEYDLYYITHRSLTTDVLILLETLFFSVAQVGRVLRRRRSPDEGRPGTIGAVDDGGRAAAAIVVALDQRASIPHFERWQQFVPVAYALSIRWPVRVLAAGANVPALDALLAPTVARLGTRGYRLQYVPYVGPGELRTLVSDACLVITDLPHVAARARRAGVDVLAIRDDSIERHRSATRPADDVLESLARALPQTLRPAASRNRDDGARPATTAYAPPAPPPI
ncbi:MAG TPA: sugar transferase [Gemmatimonadaceae bacterium]|nr:sugar transferase [Gemmatimonadaceae bacterium]